SPSNGASRISRTSATMSWGSSARATRYEYCADRTNNNTCDSGVWISVSVSLSATMTGLVGKSTYYWQVRAVNTSTGEITNANSGTWWNFRTQ
ncbi:MAG: hypothetical protein ACKPBG_03440, partial [Actinomycetota bacterium]